MRLANIVPPVVALVLGCVLALVTATLAANVIETRSKADVERVLGLNGHDWASVEVDGLQVQLAGMAPDEATRFRALSAAGTVVDSARVIDAMDVVVAEPITPPRFSIEILRNDDGISLIGLVPASMDRETVVAAITERAQGASVTDLLNVADFAEPEGWGIALSYGLEALAILPRSKISISAGKVEIIANSESETARRNLETELLRDAPEELRIAVEISAPRPVITPYTLRFLIDDEGTRFDACSTDTEAGRDRILAAASAAGLSGKSTCTIGLGIPSPSWDDAVIEGINALSEIGGGSVTFSDADVTFVATPDASQAAFDRIVGELEAALPDAFSLHAVLPEPVTIDGTGDAANAGPPEFVATLSPEGLVQLRGRIGDDRTRIATESFARALFGSEAVNGTMRLDPGLPDGWSARVLVSLEALGNLSNGSVVAQPEFVEVRGKTGNEDAKAEIARILSEKLGQSENYRINVLYEEKLDPLANIPTPEECVAMINKVLSIQQITFAPSSADIDDVARDTIDNIVELMENCAEVPMEIGGHTDSQGREVMNQALSQSRAEAVVNALLARRVLTTNLKAVGYGETAPIADNDTEEGREANRRIEFKLIVPEETEAEQGVASGNEPATEPEPESEQENSDEQN